MRTVEIWKQIEGYEGYYEVSDRGRVRSIKRIIKRSDGKIKTFKEVIRKPQTSNGNGRKDGYQAVFLCRNGHQKRCCVHRLVANAFIKNKPKNCKYEVMHLDGDKLNNHASNLRYGSRKCNMAFKVEHGTDIKGERAYNSVLTKKDVLKIRRLYDKGTPFNIIAKMFNQINSGGVHNIITRRSWAWLEQK